MTTKELLVAFQQGELNAAEVLDQIRALKPHNQKPPLSEGQKSLWIIQKLYPNASAYNVPICIRFGQQLDAKALEQACRFVTEQHRVTACVIDTDQGIPYQKPSSSALSFGVEDISNLRPEDTLALLREKSRQPFALEQGPTLRVHLLVRSSTENILLIVIHHIIFDAGSLEPFLTTLFGAYHCFRQGLDPTPDPGVATYSDFVAWERAYLKSPLAEQDRGYWLQVLSGELPLLELPSDRPRKTEGSSERRILSRVLSPAMSASIRSFCRSTHITPAVMLLGCYKILLHRYTGISDILVGMPTPGRPEARFDRVVGYFVNILAVRSQVSGTLDVFTFFKNLRLTVADALDHAHYPFSSVVADLKRDRGDGSAKVFQTTFDYKGLHLINTSALEQPTGSLSAFEYVEDVFQDGEYEIALEVLERSEEFALRLRYDPTLFDLTKIERLATHLQTLIQGALAAPHCRISDLPLLDEAERRRLLGEWNDTEMGLTMARCIHELFEVQVRLSPSASAAVSLPAA